MSYNIKFTTPEGELGFVERWPYIPQAGDVLFAEVNGKFKYAVVKSVASVENCGTDHGTDRAKQV